MGVGVGVKNGGQREEGRREREGSCHKLFYSYPALPMYVGLVNNASPQRIIRTTTLFFSLTHSSR